MRSVFVSLEHRFYEFENKLYTKLAFSNVYWNDYLSFFDKIVVVARVEVVDTWDESFVRVDGNKVHYVKVPYYVGPKQFLLNLPKILKVLIDTSSEGEKFLLRSGNVSNCLWPFLILRRKSYIREYPGNVKEGVLGFTGNTFKNRIFATLMDWQAKLQSKFSKANSFVSHDCKNLYSSKKPSYVFSSFNADEIQCEKSNYNLKDEVLRIIFVGRLEGEKGHADALKAIDIFTNMNKLDVHVTFIGDGSKKFTLQEMARQLNVNVNFLGAVTNRYDLFKLVAENDLYIIPSHTEGMPRSLLEAMAIGMPCIGSKVGGIPEVLDSQALFVPNSVDDLVNKITLYNSDSELRKAQGIRNKLFIEEHFSQKVLRERKHKFWSSLYE